MSTSCQHLDCSAIAHPIPLPAEWTVTHSGYRMHVCGPHYGTLTRELIAARIAYDSSLITCKHGLAAPCSPLHYGLVTT